MSRNWWVAFAAFHCLVFMFGVPTFSTKGVMIGYVLMAVSVLIAIPVQGSFLLGALVLTRGLAHGGAIVDIPVMSKHCFGPKVLGRTFSSPREALRPMLLNRSRCAEIRGRVL